MGQQGKTADQSRLEELLAKFDNGIERYQKSNVFHKVIDSLLHGVDEISIIDQLIEIVDNTNKHMEEVLKVFPIPPVIIKFVGEEKKS